MCLFLLKDNNAIPFFKGLKARHPDKNWSQLTENLLMLCQSSTEDVSLNQSLHKVCYQLSFSMHCSIQSVVQEVEL